MTTALALNCTLKPSPETSNTAALLGIVLDELSSLGVQTEQIRVCDYNIPFGVQSEMGDGDEWPQILDRIRAANILIIGTPIWLGHKASVTQMVLERMDALLSETNDKGQLPLYNKVAGVVVTGNEDGAHACAESILFNLTHLGATVPPNVDCYWLGKAGPGPSFLDADGEHHEYTRKAALYTANNLAWFARLLEREPIGTDLNELNERARQAAQVAG